MKPSARPDVGKIRIIGGRWRGTRLAVPASPGLRPSSDRVRETLFNWLSPMLPGARVLDAFAGTGALGLEAVSRGAANASLVERDATLCQALRDTVGRLSAQSEINVVQGDVVAWLGKQPPASFDLAFIDPPFEAALWRSAMAALVPVLSTGAWVYVESPPDTSLALPVGWLPHREGTTRDVRYAVYRTPDPHPADTLNGNLSVTVPE